MKEWTVTVRITDEVAKKKSKLNTSEQQAVQQRLADDVRIILAEATKGLK